MEKKILCLIAGVAMAAAAFGATILSETNSLGVGVPGLYAVSWTETTSWAGVTIAAPLLDISSSSPALGTAFLMMQIGPGTTPASEIGSPFAIDITNTSYVLTTLFSGLSLGPGTYYLVIDGSPNAATTHLLWSVGAFVKTAGPGVAQNSDQVWNGTPQTFLPATSFANIDVSSLLFTVTGTESTDSEPAAFSLVGLGIGGIGLLRRRRRR